MGHLFLAKPYFLLYIIELFAWSNSNIPVADPESSYHFSCYGVLIPKHHLIYSCYIYLLRSWIFSNSNVQQHVQTIKISCLYPSLEWICWQKIETDKQLEPIINVIWISCGDIYRSLLEKLNLIEIFISSFCCWLSSLVSKPSTK